MRPFRFLASRLSDIPLWIKIPVILAEITTLTVLFTWVYVTRSVETVKVPTLTGKTLRQARAELRTRDLSFRVIRRYSMETPEGKILRQRPPAGAQIKETRSIELFVSEGPEYVTVPNLRGKSVLGARNKLYEKESGRNQNIGPILNLGKIARVHSNDVDEGRIILQNPKPNRKAIRGAQVDVLVSKGEWPERIVIPDVVGMTVSKARKLLNRSGVRISQINYRYEEEKAPSVILEQTPPAGRIVRSSSAINLIANLSRDQTTIPERYTFLRITSPLGIEPGRLRVQLIDRKGSRTVYNRRVRPGQVVETLVSVKGEARVIIYWRGSIHQFRRINASDETISVNSFS